jgi:hypothetical protein
MKTLSSAGQVADVQLLRSRPETGLWVVKEKVDRRPAITCALSISCGKSRGFKVTIKSATPSSTHAQKRSSPGSGFKLSTMDSSDAYDEPIIGSPPSQKVGACVVAAALNPATPANTTEVSPTPRGCCRDRFLGGNLDLW